MAMEAEVWEGEEASVPDPVFDPINVWQSWKKGEMLIFQNV